MSSPAATHWKCNRHGVTRPNIKTTCSKGCIKTRDAHTLIYPGREDELDTLVTQLNGLAVEIPYWSCNTHGLLMTMVQTQCSKGCVREKTVHALIYSDRISAMDAHGKPSGEYEAMDFSKLRCGHGESLLPDKTQCQHGCVIEIGINFLTPEGDAMTGRLGPGIQEPDSPNTRNICVHGKALQPGPQSCTACFRTSLILELASLDLENKLTPSSFQNDSAALRLLAEEWGCDHGIHLGLDTSVCPKGCVREHMVHLLKYPNGIDTVMLATGKTPMDRAVYAMVHLSRARHMHMTAFKSLNPKADESMAYIMRYGWTPSSDNKFTPICIEDISTLLGCRILVLHNWQVKVFGATGPRFVISTDDIASMTPRELEGFNSSIIKAFGLQETLE